MSPYLAEPCLRFRALSRPRDYALNLPMKSRVALGGNHLSAARSGGGIHGNRSSEIMRGENPGGSNCLAFTGKACQITLLNGAQGLSEPLGFRLDT